MRKSSAARSPKSSPNCSAKRMARRPHQIVVASSTERTMTRRISRRAFLNHAAGGLAAVHMVSPFPARAQAQSMDAIAFLEVNARALTSFDLRNPSHVRFGSFQFRSGLVLTSPFRKFGRQTTQQHEAAGEN